MRRQLDDLHEAGEEPLAVLTATEPAIYGRFGYGTASRKVDARLDAGGVRLQLPPSAEKVRLRLVDEPALVREECEEVYAACVPRRAGMLERLPGWENVASSARRSGATARRRPHASSPRAAPRATPPSGAPTSAASTGAPSSCGT